jgi:ABC-type dipeptide/oligopeptide/nickel transport system ATPase component
MELHRSAGIGYLLITHDFAVAGDLCEKIVVLNEGRVVETGHAASILVHPTHTYTQGLLRDVLPPPYTQHEPK